MACAKILSDELAKADPGSYVRLTAHWLTHGDPADDPGQSADPRLGALVASAAAYRARALGQEPPAWAWEPSRILPSFWHPGEQAFFAWSLAHTPADFLGHGVVIERDSLESV
ncbi:MAG: hypothetical protein LBR32_04480 [Propionibacteriaceae bacterium]|nr:hypothetical protein [Propionibacteriaceae bacterium]